MYANVFEQIKQVDLTAVCDLDESKLDGLTDATSYTDHFEMVDEEDLDISIIGTPPSARADLLRASLESEATVFLEKPTAVDLSSFNELHSIAEQHSAPVSTVQNLLYTPTVDSAIQLADDGIIGDVVSVEVVWREYIDPAGEDMNQGVWVQDLPVGGISESLPHFIYLALGFVDGLENFTVQWQALNSQGDAPDALAILGSDSSGRIVKVQWTGQCPSRKRQIRVYGSEGEMTVDIDTRTVTVERDGGSDSIRPLQHSNIPNPIRNRWSRGHYRMIMDLVDSKLDGNPTPPVPLDQDRDVIQVFEAAGNCWRNRE